MGNDVGAGGLYPVLGSLLFGVSSLPINRPEAADAGNPNATDAMFIMNDDQQRRFAYGPKYWYMYL